MFTFHDLVDRVWGIGKAEETLIGEAMSPLIKVSSL